MESMPTVRRKPVKVLHSNAVVKPFAERSRSDFAGFGSAQPAAYYGFHEGQKLIDLNTASGSGFIACVTGRLARLT